MEAGGLPNRRLRPPPSVFWFLFHAEKELAAGGVCWVPPGGAGSFSTWKRNQKTPGGGRNRRFGKPPASMPPVPLEPPFTGVIPLLQW